jgi:nucleoside-diphosphate-sugar epimerase
MLNITEEMPKNSVANGAEDVRQQDLSGLTSRDDIITAIKKVYPPTKEAPQDAVTLQKLQFLTDKLTQAYQESGQLHEDPFADVYQRNIHCYDAEATEQLKDQVVLVTGGEGCVGGYLIDKLHRLGAGKIVSVDFARCHQHGIQPEPKVEGNRTYYAFDICDSSALEKVFDAENPRFVFHLAAQRLPGLAERQVRETVVSNLKGTQNMIALCEKYGVEKCIFSSTGKASRYTTTEVYAATKKVAEWLFEQASRKQTGVTYGMVRFTHMLDNSSVCEQYDKMVAEGKIANIHAPNKFLLAQNAGEAVHLLINSFVKAIPEQLEFVLCRNLGWPVETLEIALYKILASGKKMPIYFQGSPVGYEEGFFRGQVNWDYLESVNMLINALEVPASRIDPSGDFIISPTLPMDEQVLNSHLEKIAAVLDDPTAEDARIKSVLGDAVQAIAGSVYSEVPLQELIKVLEWGTDPSYLALDGTTLDSHQRIIRLLVESLTTRYNNRCQGCDHS